MFSVCNWVNTWKEIIFYQMSTILVMRTMEDLMTVRHHAFDFNFPRAPTFTYNRGNDFFGGELCGA